MTAAPHIERPGSRLPTVASLLPAATEIACALGLQPQLAGVSHECDWPEGVSKLPILTASRVGRPGSSAAVDAEVRALLADALAIYTVDVAALERAAPDVVVTQDLCDVCAVSVDAVRAALREVAPQAELVSLSPTCLAEVWEDVRRLGRATGTEQRAEEVLAEFDARLAAIRARAEATAERPRVLTLEWLEPAMVGGLWMPELVELAGGTALVTRPGQHAPTLSRDELMALEPDVVLIKPCGYALDETLAEGDLVREILEETKWPAWESGRVWVSDGNAFFNRPGPRLVESVEILAACLHPGEFGRDLGRRHGRWFRRFE